MATNTKSNVGKILPAMLFILLVGPGSLRAQALHNAISVDVFLSAMSPISRLAGEQSSFIPINVKYQRQLTEQQVLMIKMGFNYNWDSDGDKSLDIYPMIALEWHPYNKDMKGFYLGPSLFFNFSNYSYSETTTANNLDHSYWLAIGGNIGYQFMLKSNMIVDITFGLGYGYSKEVDISGDLNSGFRVDETIGGIFVGCKF